MDASLASPSFPGEPGEETGRVLVLVLDDDPLVLRSMGRVLQRLGVATSLTDRAETFFLLLGQHRPRLALIDAHMPGMDGDAVVRRIKRDPMNGATRVIVRSALDEARLADLATACGADGYLLKTARLADVERRISRWLAG